MDSEQTSEAWAPGADFGVDMAFAEILECYQSVLAQNPSAPAMPSVPQTLLLILHPMCFPAPIGLVGVLSDLHIHDR